MNTDKRKDLLKRAVSVAILIYIYSLIMTDDVDIFGDSIDFFVRTGITVIVTLIYYFISTKYLKISYDNKGLDRTAAVFMFINLIFCFVSADSMMQGIFKAYLSSIMYAYIVVAAFGIIYMCRCIKRRVHGDGAYRKTAKDFSSGRKKDIDRRKKENESDDEYSKEGKTGDGNLTYDEDLPVGSSEIILIPGIDENFKEVGSNSDD